MALQNLFSLRKNLISSYKSLSFDEECRLPIEIKNNYKTISKSKLYFYEYTFKVTSSTGMSIFLPNQVWYIANHFVDLYNELQNYHNTLINLFGDKNTNKDVWVEIDNAKNKKTGDSEYVKIQEKLKALGNQTDEDYLLKFITDFKSWGGAKALGRTQNDFYVSSILDACSLVQDSQTYVAQICAALGANPAVSTALKNFYSKNICSSKAVDFSDPLQQIFYGAPGTGKSHKVDKECAKFSHHRTTFHPDSDYSTFVGCYKPTKVNAEKIYNTGELISLLSKIKSTGTSYPCQKWASRYWESIKELSTDVVKNILNSCGFTDSMTTEVSKSIAVGEEFAANSKTSQITYAFTPQAFTIAYIEAWQKFKANEKVYLVIEEINRGNCAQIFGDLFQLLDRNEDGYSTYPIEPDTDLGTYISEQGLNVQNAILKKKDGTTEDISGDISQGKKLVLPPNLYIWATMNTSDQSLFPIDSAFKRRWDWKYVPIDTEKENWAIEVNGKKYSWTSFLDIINEKIFDKTQSEDKQLGFYFCKAENNVISASKFVSKVLFYLYNDVFKDYGFDEDFFKDDDSSTISFRKFYKGLDMICEEKVEKILMNLNVELYKEGKEEEDGGSEVEEDETTAETFPEEE